MCGWLCWAACGFSAACWARVLRIKQRTKQRKTVYYMSREDWKAVKDFICFNSQSLEPERSLEDQSEVMKHSISLIIIKKNGGLLTFKHLFLLICMWTSLSVKCWQTHAQTWGGQRTMPGCVSWSFTQSNTGSFASLLPSPASQTRLASGESLVSPFHLSVGGLGWQVLGGSELRSSGLALYPPSHLFSPLKHSNKRFKRQLLQA